MQETRDNSIELVLRSFIQSYELDTAAADGGLQSYLCRCGVDCPGRISGHDLGEGGGVGSRVCVRETDDRRRCFVCLVRPLSDDTKRRCCATNTLYEAHQPLPDMRTRTFQTHSQRISPHSPSYSHSQSFHLPTQPRPAQPDPSPNPTSSTQNHNLRSSYVHPPQHMDTFRGPAPFRLDCTIDSLRLPTSYPFVRRRGQNRRGTER